MARNVEKRKTPFGYTTKPKKSPQTKSQKAGLTFSVTKIHKKFKQDRHEAVRIGASIYLTAVIEYLTAELLELAGNAARDNKKGRIIPRHVQLAVRNDEELSKMLGDVTIAQGGVLPHIQSVLLPPKKTQ